MILSVHQPQYIPWLGYFDKIARSDAFVFLDNVQYKAREFQNRNKIRTKDGDLWLSVPVVSKGLRGQLVRDVAVDNSVDWAHQHISSIRVSYGHAEFFKKHIPFFEELYAKRWDRLSDISIEIIKYVLRELVVHTPLHFESKLGITSKKTDRIIDICRKMKADTYLSGAGGRDYLEEEKFAAAGIRLLYQEFAHPVYRQQYMKSREDFLPYMSILDLLFNEGPESRDILGINNLTEA